MRAHYYILVLFFLGCLTGPLFATDYRGRELIIQTVSPLSSLSQIKTSSGSQRDPILKKYLMRKMESLKGPRHLSKKAPKSWGNLYRLVFSEDVDLKAAIRQFQKDPNIVFVQPNFIYHTFSTPNDLYYSQQWSLPFIKADQAWTITQGDPKVVIAVIDTGVDWKHEDLKNSIWSNSKEIPNDGIDNDDNGYIDDVRGWNFVDLQSTFSIITFPEERYFTRDNDPMDCLGHGTAISGIIAAEINNSLGIAGIAPACKVMAIRAGYKTLGPDGVTGAFETIDLCDAILYAADNGAKVINLSLGRESEPRDPEELLLRNAINYAQSLGCMVVVAVGNSRTNLDQVPYIPVRFSGVIAVSALKSDGQFDASYSNYGNQIDLSAPGSGIIFPFIDPTVTDPTEPPVHQQYLGGDGTSFAAPMVCAAIGLLLSYNPDLSTSDIYQALTASAEDVGPSGKDPYYGYGQLNIYKALTYVDPSPPEAVHTQLITTSNTGAEILVTMSITTKSKLTPNAKLYYCVTTTANGTFNWKNISIQRISGTIFGATIAAPDISMKHVYYYFAIGSNPNTAVTLPETNPTTNPYHIVVKDIIGPTITSLIQNQDYIHATQTVTFNIIDNTEVSSNTLAVGVYNPATSLIATYNLTSSVLTFTNSVLSVDLTKLTISSGSIRFLISVSDTKENTSTKELTCLISGSSDKLILTGPTVSTPILNYPNPFNPHEKATSLCYMVSKPASVRIDIYSLNLTRVKRFELSDTTGYHEVLWDGRDEFGDVVPVGVYLFFITAEADGVKVVKRNKIAVVY